MHKSALFAAAVAAVALGTLTGSARAAHIPIPNADYSAAITSRLAGNQPAGWTFGWASDGVLDGSYTNLVQDNGRLETVANAAYPDPAPGSSLTLGRGATTPTFTYVGASAVAGNFGIASLPLSFVRPGDTVGTAPNLLDVVAAVGYTFTLADLGGGPKEVFIESFSFGVADQWASGIRTQVFKNGGGAPLFANLFNSGDFFDSAFPQALGGGPFSIGTFAPGDTVFFTFGAAGVPTGDEMRFNFTLATVPEPGALGLAFVVALVPALRRRRARVR